jgi:hypothetical protein
MTLVTTTPFRYPGWLQTNSQNINGIQTLDASGEYCGYVYQALEDMTISCVGWRSSASGSPTAEIRIETVNAAGYATGTLWTADSNVVTGTIVTNTWRQDNLTTAAVVTRGQFFAIKWVYLSGTNLAPQNDGNSETNSHTIPYEITNVSGADAKSRADRQFLALGSSPTSFYHLPHALPVSAQSANTFNNTGSTTHGLRFRLPFPAQLIGVRMVLNAAVGDFNLVCYDNDGNELTNTAIDGNYNYEGNQAASNFFFTNPITLQAGVWYRVAQEATTSTNSNINTITLHSPAYLTACPFGTDGHYTTRAAGVWSDTQLQFPLYDLWLRKVDDAANTVSTIGRVIGS